VGTEAYADYVNASGGVDGRKIVVDSSDDHYSGAPNKQETQADVGSDFAMVGSFSLFDNFGGTVLQANPQVPNVTVSLDLTTADLPNSFSPAPAVNGWQLGALTYFANKFPADVTHTGALIADEPSATSKWAAEKAAMGTRGYKVVFDPTFDISTTDFNQYVVQMKSDGVKILFLEQMPENYAAAVVKALNQQDFRPVVVFGGPTRAARPPSTAPTWNRTPPSSSARTHRRYPPCPPSSPGCKRHRPGSTPICTPCMDGCPPSSSLKR
jgi:hypothetical protein